MHDAEILDSFKNKRCLVTGGTGLIGRQVVEIIASAGAEVTVASLDNLKLNSAATYRTVDLTDITACRQLVSGQDFVFHLAGIKGSVEVTRRYPASFYVPLVLMNTNILEAAREASVAKLVYTSSIGAYSPQEIFREEIGDDGPPMDMYPGWAKRMAELQITAYKEQYSLDWAVVRPCNVYGPGDNFDPRNAMVVPSLLMRIMNGENPLRVWGDGSAIRDFAFSRDVAMGVIRALKFGTRGSYVNLGSGNGVSIKELVTVMASIANFDFEFDDSKVAGYSRRVMDVTRAKEWLGYSHNTSLHAGLSATWSWLQENKEEYLSKKNYFSEINE